jgi:hypothetical protein
MQSIKYDKVICEWIDIQGGESWNSLDDVINLKPATCNTLGYLFSKDERHTKIFGSYSINDDGSYDYGDVVCITTSCVVKLEKIGN